MPRRSSAPTGSWSTRILRARSLKAHSTRLREKHGAGEFPAVDVIPHGVDRSRFHPFPGLLQTSFASPGRAEAKRKVFAGLEDLANSFIVLNASRFDKRKRIDVTIGGFARFAAGKPANVRLCLHHAILGEAGEKSNRIADRAV